MPHGVLVVMLVDMGREQCRVEPELPVQKSRQISRRPLKSRHNLHAVAGGDDHALRHARHRSQRPRCLGQVLPRNRNPLA